jgi:transposase
VLVAAAEDVYEVPSNLSHREARRQNRGKSDTIDAVAIARVVARGDALPRPRVNQRFEDLKLLSDHHDHLKRLRTQLTNRIHKQLMIAHPGYHRSLGSMRSEKAKRSTLMMLRRDNSVRAELIKRNVRELRRLDAEIKELKANIRRAVAATGTSLTSQCGIGSVIAARLLGEVGDVSNLRSKAGFARLTGTAPIPASSGKTSAIGSTAAAIASSTTRSTSLPSRAAGSTTINDHVGTPSTCVCGNSIAFFVGAKRPLSWEAEVLARGS